MRAPKVYITVCKNTILGNRKHGRNDPPIRVSEGKHGKPRRAHRVKIRGNAEVVYSPSRPLPWGARAWIEVRGTVL